nr:YoaH family protein [Thaumasiovibrio occultus]
MSDPTLTHEEQQEAADRIHALMAQGMSSGEAIMKVANEIRQQKQAKE